MAKLKVTCYKQSGKYYDSKTTRLTDGFYTNPFFNKEKTVEELQNSQINDLIRLAELIKRDDEMVFEFSPLISGFSKDFNWVIEVILGDGEAGFCNFFMEAKK